MAPRSSKRRQNGFSPPFSTPQICAWIALVVSLLQFGVFVTPVLPLVASIPVTIYFTACVLAVLYYGGKAQIVDPIDVHLAQTIRTTQVDYFPPKSQTSLVGCLYRINNQSLLHGYPEQETAAARATTTSATTSTMPSEEMKQCWICDARVADHSMHCKFCNKCIYHFDHHCMWLNTCVGSANYIYFFRTMQMLCVMETSHLLIQLALVLDYFLSDQAEERFDNWLSLSGKANVVLIVLFIFMAFNIGSIVLISQLLSFHVGLQRNKMTTYQFIVQDHKKKRERMRLEDDLTSKRTLAIAAAYQNKKTCQAWTLRMGGKCRAMGCAACDVMELPEHKEPDPEAGFAAALGGQRDYDHSTPNIVNHNSSPDSDGDNNGDDNGEQESTTSSASPTGNEQTKIEASLGNGASAQQEGATTNLSPSQQPFFVKVGKN